MQSASPAKHSHGLRLIFRTVVKPLPSAANNLNLNNWNAACLKSRSLDPSCSTSTLLPSAFSFAKKIPTTQCTPMTRILHGLRLIFRTVVKPLPSAANYLNLNNWNAACLKSRSLDPSCSTSTLLPSAFSFAKKIPTTQCTPMTRIST